MNKWIAEFELEDGDTMPEHMDLEYKGAKIDFHCKPLKQEPCEDCISRQDALDCLTANGLKKFDFIIDARDKIRNLPSVKPQEPKLNKLDEIITDALEQESKVGHWKDFVLWVANEIFDEMWEYNADAFAEIACRKLAKLGIVRAKDDEWELVEPQESEG